MSNLQTQLLDLASRPAIAEKYGLLLAQTTHRIGILYQAGIKDGDRILELGCGQGDCTTVLAILFPKSRIDAIDPAPGDYGEPETLGQAHQRIKSYDIGERISFYQDSPIGFLGSVDEGTYDVAVLCHCLWYFASTEEIVETFKATRGKANRLVIAEWGLRGDAKSNAHVLAALTRACREAHNPDSDANIRTPVSPKAIKDLAAQAGWTFRVEQYMTPSEELQDAEWEVNMLLAGAEGGPNRFLEQAKQDIRDDRVYTLLETMVESVKSGVAAVGGKERVRCMDVWVGCFGQ